jgi:hypothetical protein
MKATSSIKTNGMKKRNKIPKKYDKHFYDGHLEEESFGPYYNISNTSIIGMIIFWALFISAAIWGINYSYNLLRGSA